MTKLNEMAEEWARKVTFPWNAPDAPLNNWNQAAAQAISEESFKAGYLAALESSEVRGIIKEAETAIAFMYDGGIEKVEKVEPERQMYDAWVKVLAAFRKMREGVGK